MGRIKQPRELAELSGATRKNPQRYRDTIPKHPEPLGDPPSHLTDEEKATWQVIAEMAEPGVLTKAEGILVEITAGLLTTYRRNPREFPTSKYRILMTCFSKLGIRIK